MNPELKEKWLRALRSKRYKQGTGTLRERNDGVLEYCCLGVLCNVMDANWKESEDESFTCQFSNWDGALLNSKTLAKIDLSNSAQLGLSSKNDCGLLFSEIADYIESNL